MNFHVIEGIKTQVPDYFSIYNRIFIQCVKESAATIDDINELDLIKKKRIIYFGVKMLASSRKNKSSKQGLPSAYSLASAIKNMISFLTPNDFETIFPIEKTYDGEKYQTKDYFFTKKMMKEIGEDELIGNKIDTFLWDYQNWDVSFFMIEIMSMIDEMRRLEGEKGVLEEFFEEKGLPTYTMYEKEKGKKFIVNNTTNEVTEMKRPKPRYLNLVKEKSPTSNQEN